MPKKVTAFLVINGWVIDCPLKGGPVAVRFYCESWCDNKILLLLLKKGTGSWLDVVLIVLGQSQSSDWSRCCYGELPFHPTLRPFYKQGPDDAWFVDEPIFWCTSRRASLLVVSGHSRPFI